MLWRAKPAATFLGFIILIDVTWNPHPQPPLPQERGIEGDLLEPLANHDRFLVWCPYRKLLHDKLKYGASFMPLEPLL